MCTYQRQHSSRWKVGSCPRHMLKGGLFVAHPGQQHHLFVSRVRAHGTAKAAISTHPPSTPPGCGLQHRRSLTFADHCLLERPASPVPASYHVSTISVPTTSSIRTPLHPQYESATSAPPTVRAGVGGDPAHDRSAQRRSFCSQHDPTTAIHNSIKFREASDSKSSFKVQQTGLADEARTLGPQPR